MIATFQICGSHLSDTRYGVRREFIECGGWEPFIDKYIAPDIAWGSKRILLHLPFACEAGVYQFDQWLTAKNAGLITTKDFVRSVRVLRGAAGVEVICYLGTLHGDKDFDSRKRPERGDDYMRRFTDSLAPVFDAGCSIAFDWSNDFQPGSLELSAIDFAAAIATNGGGKAYIEPAAQQTHAHMAGWASVTQDLYYQSRRSDWCETKAEVIRWVDDPPDAFDADRLAKRFRAILDDGHTPAGIVGFLREAGFKASEFQ